MEKGELETQVHCYCLKVVVFCNVVIGTGLLDMYSKCLNIEDSRRVFDGMINKNVITWTAMISDFQGMDRKDCLMKHCFSKRNVKFGA